MKILFIITELNPGGAENALCQIACHLAKDNDIYIIRLYGGKTELTKKLNNAGVKNESLEINGVFDLFKLFKLKKRIEEINPDIVNSWLIHANLAVRYFCPAKFPLFNSLRVEDKRLHINFLELFSAHKADNFLCVSDNVKNYAINKLKIPPHKCITIENGIDCDLFKPLKQKSYNLNNIKGLTVARICYQKGIDILIDALNEIPTNYNWQWTIIGSIEENNYFEMVQEKIKHLNLQDKITFLPQVPQTKLPQYFAQSNIFILPSRWEGQPNIIREAMAMGIPTYYCNKIDADDNTIKNGILNAIKNPTPPQNQSFLSWSQTAKIYLKALNPIA